MNGKNLVQLVGYVGQDLKESRSEQGHQVALRVATHYSHTDPKGQKVNQTTWHNVVAWDETAEYAGRNFVKGSKILVEGRIIYGHFAGMDGSRRPIVQIRAHHLLNLDR
jgi:single-strand DNA-binding protein